MPIVVVGEGAHIVVDGFKRVRALKQLRSDVVLATAWDLDEADALVFERLMRVGEGDGALEQGWLLRELEVRFGQSQEELARRFDKSVSWVSRRLRGRAPTQSLIYVDLRPPTPARQSFRLARAVRRRRFRPRLLAVELLEVGCLSCFRLNPPRLPPTTVTAVALAPVVPCAEHEPSPAPPASVRHAVAPPCLDRRHASTCGFHTLFEKRMESPEKALSITARTITGSGLPSAHALTIRPRISACCLPMSASPRRHPITGYRARVPTNRNSHQGLEPTVTYRR